jgi:hypothetical protein
MKVEVIDGLAAALETVGDQAKPRLFKTKITGQRNGNLLEPAQQDTVLGSGVEERGDVLSRDDQEVHRSLRIDVVKGHDLIVLVGQFSRNLTTGDLAEKTIVHQ